jgi:L-arabinonolactonase
MASPIDVIPVRNVLGECISWHHETQSLWWTDIQARRLFRHDPAMRTTQSFATPERLASFGFSRETDKFIAAFETGIALYDPHTQALSWLCRPHLETRDIRFNDGRVDRQGRFWTGTMIEGPEAAPSSAALYSIDHTRALRPQVDNIAISNGICWSPDGTRMYFADSPTRTIYAYDFDGETGTIANRRVFARTPEGAYPDGANVDSEGFLWSAHWGAGKVVRYAPDGTIDRALTVPAEQPTCVAFGGPKLDLIFVASARDGLAKDALARQPSAGDVFIYKAPVPGIADGRYHS